MHFDVRLCYAPKLSAKLQLFSDLCKFLRVFLTKSGVFSEICSAELTKPHGLTIRFFIPSKHSGDSACFDSKHLRDSANLLKILFKVDFICTIQKKAVSLPRIRKHVIVSNIVSP